MKRYSYLIGFFSLLLFPRLSSAVSAIALPTLHWPGGVIPYTIDSSVSQATQNEILAAAETYARLTPIHFVPRTTQTDYVEFLEGEALDALNCHGKPCSSAIGKFGGRQTVTFPARGSDSGLSQPVLHEMGHVIGLYHEHSRPDRNCYIQVMWQNIQAGLTGQFELSGGAGGIQLLTPYDSHSIMHYPGYNVGEAINPFLPTMVGLQNSSIPSTDQNNQLSPLDIQGINQLYSPSFIDHPAYSEPIVAVLGSDNQVYVEQLNSKGPRLPYTLTSPGKAKAIGMGQTAYGIPMIVALSLANQIYTETLNPDGTSCGYTLSGPDVAKAISIAQIPGAIPVIAAIGSDNLVYTESLGLSGLGQGWSLTAGGSVKAISSGAQQLTFPHAISINPFISPFIAAIGFDGMVYFQTHKNGFTSYQLTTGGQAKAVSVGMNASGTTLIAAIGLDNRVYTQTLDSNGASSGYTLVSPEQVKAISLSLSPNGSPLLAAIGLDNQAYTQLLNPNGTGTGYKLVSFGQANPFTTQAIALWSPILR